MTDMGASLRFMWTRLGDEALVDPDQTDGQGDYEFEGKIRWCWLELGEAAIMCRSFCRAAGRTNTWKLELTFAFSGRRAGALSRIGSGKYKRENAHRREIACGGAVD